MGISLIKNSTHQEMDIETTPLSILRTAVLKDRNRSSRFFWTVFFTGEGLSFINRYKGETITIERSKE